MHPPGGGPHGRRDVFQERDDVVVRAFFYLGYFGDGKTGPLPNLRCVRFRNLAQLGHRFTGQRFDLQPDLELALFRPKLTHLRPGITIDHPRKIKARRETESVLYAKKRRFGGIDR